MERLQHHEYCGKMAPSSTRRGREMSIVDIEKSEDKREEEDMQAPVTDEDYKPLPVTSQMELLALELEAMLQSCDFDPGHLVNQIHINASGKCDIHLTAEGFAAMNIPEDDVEPDIWPKYEKICSNYLSEEGHRFFTLTDAKFTWEVGK
jgi:hypothetical protein